MQGKAYTGLMATMMVLLATAAAVEASAGSAAAEQICPARPVLASATETDAPSKAADEARKSEPEGPDAATPPTLDPTQELDPARQESIRDLRRRIIRSLRPINRTRNLA